MRLVVDRKGELNGRALSQLTRELDVPAVDLHDLAADAETESVGFSAALRSEAPVKDPRNEIGRNTGARIRDLDVNRPSG